MLQIQNIQGCCSNKKTPPYQSQSSISFVTLRNRRPTLLRAPAYRTPSEAGPALALGPRRRCAVRQRESSHIIQLTLQNLSAGAELRNSACADALAMARRPKEAWVKPTCPFLAVHGGSVLSLIRALLVPSAPPQDACTADHRSSVIRYFTA